MKPEAIRAKDLKEYIGKEIEIYGNLITAKRTPTVNKEYMCFGTFFDPAGDIFDTVQFPRATENIRCTAKASIYVRAR